MMLYEIFNVESNLIAKSAKINTLLGYPKCGKSEKGEVRPRIITEKYRYSIKHKDQDLWAAPVGDELVDKCSKMTKTERDTYYNDADLKTIQYLIDNEWFEPSGP